MICRSKTAFLGYTDESGKQNIRTVFSTFHKGIGVHLISTNTSSAHVQSLLKNGNACLYFAGAAAVEPAGLRDELNDAVVLVLHAARIIPDVLGMPEHLLIFPVKMNHRPAEEAEGFKGRGVRKIEAGVSVFQLTYFCVHCNIMIKTDNLSVGQSVDIRCCARGQCLTSFEWV